MLVGFREQVKMLTYNVVCVIIFELLDVSVDERFVIPACHAEFLLASEGGCGEQDELHHGNYAIVLDDSRDRFRFTDLLGDYLRWFEEINLAIYMGLVLNLLDEFFTYLRY